jgi:hypothetical protein
MSCSSESALTVAPVVLPRPVVRGTYAVAQLVTRHLTVAISVQIFQSREAAREFVTPQHAVGVCVQVRECARFHQ